MGLQRAHDPHQLRLEAGVDEAGRGCLLGDVFAAAVVWNPDVDDPRVDQIKDSKKLSRKRRAELRVFIEDHAIAFGVASVPPARIDAVNIFWAAQEAMHAALDRVSVEFDHILVDGNQFKSYLRKGTGSRDPHFVPHTCIVGGDNAYVSIAAASILAKEYHDDHIRALLRDHPELSDYGVESNMGYGTRIHIEAIQNKGVTSWHRRSFQCCV